MSNNGHDHLNPTQITEGILAEESKPSLLFIGCATLSFGIAFIISIELFGIISVLLFIPDPPLPPNIQMISHEPIAFGVDSWIYITPQPMNEVITFYQSNTEDACGEKINPPESSTGHVVTCSTTRAISIFGLRWKVEVYMAIYDSIEQTHIDVTRTMQWNGPVDI